MVKRGLITFWLLVFFTANLQAVDINFPKLTGRVVDTAHMLSSKTKLNLINELREHEAATSNQVVVVTVDTLQGETIEKFGYQLGRYWGIGQKGKNNGVLLIIAKKERKIRIEVGYGLEGVLTDALAADIIRNQISPAFKKGYFDTGISKGVDAILKAIKGEYKASGKKSDTGSLIISIILWLLMLNFLGGVRYKDGRFRLKSGGYIGGRRSGGRVHGGGFSGGGGGFGGGGSSGGW